MPEAGKSRFDTAAERLPLWMMAVALAASLAGAVLGGARFGAGLAAGSAAAVIGYRWLHQALDSALRSGRPRLPMSATLKLAARYPLLLGVVALFYRTGWLPPRAVMAGLFVPLAGALVECALLAAEALRPAPSPQTGSGPPKFILG